MQLVLGFWLVVSAIAKKVNQIDWFQWRTDTTISNIHRTEISASRDSKVALVPVGNSQVSILREQEAWGFLRIARNPEFLAVYIGQPVGEIQYIAEIDDIVPADKASAATDLMEYRNYDPDKSVIEFVSGSLCRLKDAIPYESTPIRSLRYTTFARFMIARTTDELFT